MLTGKRRHGGFLPDEDQFDPLFFRISPTEAAMMDPQQRLFLETAYHALEDSGYAPDSLSGKRCGVFVGAGAGDYAQRFRDVGMESNPLGLMGNVTSILAARISYFLNLKGPSVALDTACSSSLVAVHLACESLVSGTTDMALAGGVAVISTPQFIVAATEGGMLSPNDRCATFDAAADGFVCGEGSGVVVLKRLADALSDGDAIHGVIRGSGINQDGRTNGITAPSAPSQAALEVEVYRRSGIDPATISYVEAHGTGTPLGDPIEVEALTSAFRRFTDRTGFCALGSAKTNIGHALTAAGIAGLLKLLLMLRHRRIPPLVGFTQANPRIDFASTPFVLPTKAEPWEAHSPRRAAVSSFGFSGTNAHIVIEEAPPAPRRAPADGPFLFVLSGRSEEARRARAAALEAHLAGATPDLRDVAFTLAAGREHYPHRLAIVAADAAELRAALRAWSAGERSPNVLVGEARPEGPGPALTALGEQMAQQAADLKALRILADLYVQGASFDWATLPGTAGGRRCTLPGYPFERVACNIATIPGQVDSLDRAHPARLMNPSAQDARGPMSTDALADLETALAARPSPDLADQAAAFQSVEAWGRRALVGAYAAMGLFDRHVYTVAGLRKAAGIVPAKQRLHDALVDMLVREEVLTREGDLLRVRGTAPTQDLADQRRRLAEAAPELAPFLALLARCIECLPDVLTARMTPTEALFPDGRMDLVEPIYQGSRLAEHFNGLLADAVSTLAARLGRPVRILEIGAGTGGATVGILSALTSSSSGPRASRSLMIMSEPEARGPEEHDGIVPLHRHLARLRAARAAALRCAAWIHAVRHTRHRTRSAGAGVHSRPVRHRRRLQRAACLARHRARGRARGDAGRAGWSPAAERGHGAAGLRDLDLRPDRRLVGVRRCRAPHSQRAAARRGGLARRAPGRRLPAARVVRPSGRDRRAGEPERAGCGEGGKPPRASSLAGARSFAPLRTTE